MFFQGLLGMILGMLVMIFRARIKDVIGDIGFAERYLGAGGTWPGEVALTISPNILTQLFDQLHEGVVIVAGTNGKTTTSLMIKQILEKQGISVIHNTTGANLLNGITSACIKESDWLGRINADWGVFETDENTLPSIIFNFQI